MYYYHKNIVTGLVITALSVGAPFAAFAENASSTKNTQAKDFCVVIQSADFKALTKFGDLLDKKEENRSERDQKIGGKRSETDQKRGESEAKFEDNQKERADKLVGKGLTDAQKAALASAQIAMQSAVDTKNGDMTALVAAYRTNMDKIRTEHRTQIDALLTQVKVDVDAAIAKAKTDCGAGVPSTTVKANFQDSMKAIHDKFKTSQDSVQVATKAEVAQTVQVRKDDAMTTRHTFRDSVKSAWSSFKSLFGKKGE
ncbi:MAG: hypothetical protein WCG20_03535 [bacterium]